MPVVPTPCPVGFAEKGIPGLVLESVRMGVNEREFSLSRALLILLPETVDGGVGARSYDSLRAGEKTGEPNRAAR